MLKQCNRYFYQCVLGAILAPLLLSACAADQLAAVTPTSPLQTSTASITPFLTLLPTPTATCPPSPTAIPPAPTPRNPTRSPLPSPAATATPVHAWQYWPNAVDFRDIAVDENGTLWISALSGLVRYEPSLDRWRVWTMADGLVNNNGVSVLLWHDEVWVGTQGGIGRLMPQTGTWQSYSQTHGLPGLRNVHLYLDRYEDTLWAGTSGGLARYAPDQDRWIAEQNAATSFDGTRQFHADKDFLWIAVAHNDITRGGIFRLDKIVGEWQDIHHMPGAPPPDNYAFAANESYLWAANTSGSVYEYDRHTGNWRPVIDLSNRIDTSFMHLVYRAPELWLSSPSRLIRYNVETGQVLRVPYPEMPFFVQNRPVFVSSAAWVPTQSGLYALENAKWVRHMPTTLPSSITAAYAASNGTLLLTTANGLGYLTPSTGAWQPFRPAPGQVQPSMAAIQRATTLGDVWAYAPQTQKLWHYAQPGSEPEPWDIGNDPSFYRLLPYFDSQALWFKVRNALVKVDLHTRRQHTYSPPAAFIGGTNQEPGAIWAIEDGHTLVRFDTRSERFALHPIPFGTNWQHIALTKNAVWLGGESSQLLSVDRGGRHWQHKDLDPTCAGAVLYALAADEQAVWVGGEHGVIHYDLETQQQTCYTTEHGMLNDQVERIILMGNWTWFTHHWYGLWGYGPQNEENK